MAAYASFPSGGNPGATVYANSCFGYTIGYSARLRNMVHELGHTIGFRHTNYLQQGESAGTDGAVQISGTPGSGSDGSSVMNGGTALNTWGGFSSYDQTATRTLYPTPAPSVSVTQAGSGNVLLSWSGLVGASYYQVRRNETYREWNGYENWSYETPTTGAWVNVYDTSFDTGSTWTGESSCYWNYGGYTEATRDAWYEVRGVFTSGAGSVWYVGSSDLTC